jgi:hypothetical protein
MPSRRISLESDSEFLSNFCFYCHSRVLLQVYAVTSLRSVLRSY